MFNVFHTYKIRINVFIYFLYGILQVCLHGIILLVRLKKIVLWKKKIRVNYEINEMVDIRQSLLLILWDMTVWLIYIFFKKKKKHLPENNTRYAKLKMCGKKVTICFTSFRTRTDSKNKGIWTTTTARGWNRDRPDKAGPAQMHKALDPPIRTILEFDQHLMPMREQCILANHNNHCGGIKNKNNNLSRLARDKWTTSSNELLRCSLLRITERSVEPSARSKV